MTNLSPNGVHAVKVGPYLVYAGGTIHMRSEDLSLVDVLLPLSGTEEYQFGQIHSVSSEQQPAGIPRLQPGRQYSMLVGRMPAIGSVPDECELFLRMRVIPLLQSEKKILGFCITGAGRTGTWLASLVAILEPETSDPIAAIRERYYHFEVDLAQARAIFALQGKEMPEKYRQEYAHWD